MLQFQVCVHTSSPSTSLTSVARLCVCVQTWWSWMSFMSFQNFPGIPPCIWPCVILFWPPGTETARLTVDICLQWPRIQTQLVLYLNFLGFVNKFFPLKEVLTPQKCAQHVIVRGLVRVRCVQEMERVLNFMTRKGLINTGVLAVKQPLLPERYCSVSILIRSGIRLSFICWRCTLLQLVVIFAEECCRHWCRGVRAGCCTAAPKLWHSGESRDHKMFSWPHAS